MPPQPDKHQTDKQQTDKNAIPEGLQIGFALSTWHSLRPPTVHGPLNEFKPANDFRF